MLDNDAFVFDCVCHVFNFDKRNAFGKPGEMFINHLYAFHQVLTPPGERVLGPEEFLREWNIDEIARMVFQESGTDMIVAQPLPLTDLFHDGLSQWEKCAAMNPTISRGISSLAVYCARSLPPARMVIAPAATNARTNTLSTTQAERPVTACTCGRVVTSGVDSRMLAMALNAASKQLSTAAATRKGQRASACRSPTSV